jgi:hypothetical protein
MPGLEYLLFYCNLWHVVRVEFFTCGVSMFQMFQTLEPCWVGTCVRDTPSTTITTVVQSKSTTPFDYPICLGNQIWLQVGPAASFPPWSCCVDGGYNLWVYLAPTFPSKQVSMTQKSYANSVQMCWQKLAVCLCFPSYLSGNTGYWEDFCPQKSLDLSSRNIPFKGISILI